MEESDKGKKYIGEIEEKLRKKTMIELNYAENEAHLKGELGREKLRASKAQEDLELLSMKYGLSVHKYV